MRTSGVVLVASSALALVFLIAWHGGRPDQSPPIPGAQRSTAPTLSKRDQIRQLLSGEFRREPRKNPVEGTGRVRGIVRDQAGAPVAGATVQLSPCDEPLNLAAPRRAIPYFWEARTDAAGYVEFRTLPAGTFVWLATHENSHGLTRVSVEEQDAFAEVSVALWPNAGRAGIVRDEAGAPVEGAVVVPIRAHDWIGDSRDYRCMIAVTDSEGRFQHPLLPEGRWQFWVAARDTAPVLAGPGADGSYAVVLGAGGELAGHVVQEEDGRPLSGARVSIQATDGPDESYEVRTNGQGHFSQAGLRPADYAVTLISDRYRASGTAVVDLRRDTLAVATAATPAARAMQIDPLRGDAVATPQSATRPEGQIETRGEVDRLVLRARRAGSIRGRVLESGVEVGVPGIEVQAFAPEQDDPVARAQTDQAGYYHLEALPTGFYRLVVSRAPGQVFVAEDSAEVTLESDAQIPGPTFRTAPAVALFGQVVDDRGAPAVEANVSVEFPGSPRPPELACADDNGLFAVTALHASDQVVVRASKLGIQSAEFGPVTIGPAGLRDVLLRLAS